MVPLHFEENIANVIIYLLKIIYDCDRFLILDLFGQSENFFVQDPNNCRLHLLQGFLTVLNLQYFKVILDTTTIDHLSDGINLKAVLHLIDFLMVIVIPFLLPIVTGPL